MYNEHSSHQDKFNPLFCLRRSRVKINRGTLKSLLISGSDYVIKNTIVKETVECSERRREPHKRDYGLEGFNTLRFN